MKRAILCAMVVFCLSVSAKAIVTPIGSDFQVTYDIGMNGTLEGNNVTHVLIFEAGDGQLSVTPAADITAKGVTSLSHTLSFEPTTAMILGLDLASPGGKNHIIMAASNEFAAASYGKLFSQTITTVNHNAVISWLLTAETDSASLTNLTNYFTGEGTESAFDPNGAFTVLEFSAPVGVGGSVPEPATAALGLMGLAGLGFSLLRRRA